MFSALYRCHPMSLQTWQMTSIRQHTSVIYVSVIMDDCGKNWGAQPSTQGLRTTHCPCRRTDYLHLLQCFLARHLILFAAGLADGRWDVRVIPALQWRIRLRINKSLNQYFHSTLQSNVKGWAFTLVLNCLGLPSKSIESVTQEDIREESFCPNLPSSSHSVISSPLSLLCSPLSSTLSFSSLLSHSFLSPPLSFPLPCLPPSPLLYSIPLSSNASCIRFLASGLTSVCNLLSLNSKDLSVLLATAHTEQVHSLCAGWWTTWSDSKGKPGCKCSTSHKSRRRLSLDLNLHAPKSDGTFVYFSPHLSARWAKEYFGSSPIFSLPISRGSSCWLSKGYRVPWKCWREGKTTLWLFIACTQAFLLLHNSTLANSYY